MNREYVSRRATISGHLGYRVALNMKLSILRVLLVITFPQQWLAVYALQHGHIIVLRFYRHTILHIIWLPHSTLLKLPR